MRTFEKTRIEKIVFLCFLGIKSTFLHDMELKIAEKYGIRWYLSNKAVLIEKY